MGNGQDGSAGAAFNTAIFTGVVFDNVRPVADAILYEGYLLYPYRRSSGKNRMRWQFGVLVPPNWAREHGLADTGVAGSAESWWQQTECLVEAPDDAILRLRLRFLHTRHRAVEQLCPDGSHRPVDRLETADGPLLSFDEAVPREFDVEVPLATVLNAQHRVEVALPGGQDIEPVPAGSTAPNAGPPNTAPSSNVGPPNVGPSIGRVVCRQWPVSAAVLISAEPCDTPFRLLRLRVRVENIHQSLPVDCPRDEALRHALLATHTMLSVECGRFLSLLDPPRWAAAAAGECHNVHTFPVLAGAANSASVVLSSPIILYDHPQVAPESPGDLHDATEIDEILSLRTLTLADAEKREVRATDPRAAEILDRVDTMPPQMLDRLHGAIRSLRPMPPKNQTEDESVLVCGVRLTVGSRVRLRPRRHGTDAHDMFLDARLATVHEVLVDVDGTRFLAVTVDDDPGAELHHWYGRLRHFRTDEVEPLNQTEPLNQAQPLDQTGPLNQTECPGDKKPAAADGIGSAPAGVSV